MSEAILTENQPTLSSHAGYQIDQFKQVGDSSKYDPAGIVDENIKLRQLITRNILGDGNLSTDPDMLKLAMKAMVDNDKTVISMARIRVDEESNAATAELAKEIALASLTLTDRPTQVHQPDLVVIEHQIDLPPPSREFVDGETETGTVQLSEQEIMSRLGSDKSK